MLSSRSGTILKSIVGQYISRAVPVPSQSIANNPDLGVSSATIRNEMARLEEEGYIIRPHTSAGSIPSDRGYRYYVESLKDVSLSTSEQRMVSHLFHQVEGEVDRWLSLAATMLSQLVQNAAVVTSPKPVDCKYKYMELVGIQDTLALIVLVLYGAHVRQKLITFDKPVTQSELTRVANKLNLAYAGKTCHQMAPPNNIELTELEKKIADLIVKLMQEEDNTEYEESFLDGLHYMLNQPEFRNSQQMLSLMELVERRNLLKTVAQPNLERHKVHVIIGSENKSEVLHNYSVVLSNYGLPEEAMGTLCVIGPTRMPYEHTIPTVAYLSAILSHLVAGLYESDSRQQAPES